MRAKIPFLLLVSLCATWLLGGLGCGQAASRQSAATAAEVVLPTPRTTGEMSIEETLAKRRSIRQFRAQALTLEQVGQLAWAAQGITKPETGFRTAPSAGALYPLELYLVKADGVFRYVAEGHRLAKLSSDDRRQALSQAALGQGSVRSAAVDFVITGVYQRTRARYGPRAELYVHLEAGHVAQNIHLQAVALGLGSVPVGAFRDKAVVNVLDLPADETPLYIIPVGRPGGG
jgi:SagB-type dehydrogenase family enzyme